MVNRRKRLEKQKARLADQALVDELAMDLASQGLGKAAVQQSIPSIHHPLYFCIRSHFTGADQKWNFSTQLAWLKHQLSCMFMASDMARGLYPVEGRFNHDQLHAMMGSYARFPTVWEGAADKPLTMEEACKIASIEDDTPKRHDLQWICDVDQTQYLDQICIPEELAAIKVTRGESPYGKLYQTTPATEQSEDLLDILFGNGEGAKLSEIAEMRLAFPPCEDPRGEYGTDHFHSPPTRQSSVNKFAPSSTIPSWTMPCPEDDTLAEDIRRADKELGVDE